MSVAAIWPLMRAALNQAGPVAQAFAQPLPDAPAMQASPPVPQGLSRPVPSGLLALAQTATATTRDLAFAVARHAGALGWRSSYPVDEAGAFAGGYAWAPLGGPDGPAICAAGLVSIMHVAPGLGYPPHHHAPEEVYLVLCGQAEFRSDRQPARLLGAGALCHHAPHETHSLTTSDSAVLVLSVWRGAYQKSDFARRAA